LKPIYQLYEERVYREQECKICGYETFKGDIEVHIRAKHTKDITPMWR